MRLSDMNAHTMRGHGDDCPPEERGTCIHCENDGPADKLDDDGLEFFKKKEAK